LLVIVRAASAQGGEGEPQFGRLIFNNACRTCHTLKEGDHRLGPSLYAMIGRKAGTAPGYGYSSSMANADFVWETETLDRFIASPDTVLPGNNMKPFGGIASPEDRASLLEFLQEQQRRD
jgi:cytochrome c